MSRPDAVASGDLPAADPPAADLPARLPTTRGFALPHLTSPGAPARARLVHLAVALVVGFRLATRDWTHLHDRPSVLLDSHGVVAWYHGVPAVGVLVALQVVGLAGVVGVVVNRRTAHAGFVVAWVCYLVLCALWGSSGKVMHNDVLTVWVAFPLLFASVPPRGASAWEVRWGWPPRAALVVLACVYWMTGLQKLRHSGLHWAFGDNMVWILRQGSSPFAQGLADWVSDHAVLAQGLAAGALALELTAPVWLLVRRTRWLFAVAVAVMHGSIWLLLGIDYSAWVLTAAAVAVPMSLDPVRLQARASARAPRPPRDEPDEADGADEPPVLTGATRAARPPAPRRTTTA